MVTGVNPAKHGIWNNNVFGPLDANRNNNYFYQVHSLVVVVVGSAIFCDKQRRQQWPHRSASA
jgi:hypothetical protein